MIKKFKDQIDLPLKQTLPFFQLQLWPNWFDPFTHRVAVNTIKVCKLLECPDLSRYFLGKHPSKSPARRKICVGLIRKVEKCAVPISVQPRMSLPNA